ncbi:MAG: hypothetical protein U0L73_07050 [Ruminococcus bromii]|jgi:hypothetical protein|nr:hypothetical protein [Ruminococcus bromii]MEE3499049.1 hypothetical protein [Ruminococcus bromii]HCB96186.1 hypothetical protein [Ruminococcus sp.]
MQTKLSSLALQSAKSELIASINAIISKYGFPASLIDGIMSSVLVEIKSQVIAELVNEKEINKEHIDE